jgi:hypothetical protein
MPELIRALAELLQSLWPLRSVWQWQRGVYYVCGRYWRTVGPGVWPVIPWFVDVRPVNVAPAIHHTALQTVTLRDGRTLVFSATITSEVEDAAAAYNRVDRWGEAVVELVAGLLSERLADADPARFDPSPGVAGRWSRNCGPRPTRLRPRSACESGRCGSGISRSGSGRTG